MSDIATLSIKVDSTDVRGATSAMGGLTNAGGMVEGMVKKLAMAWAAWEIGGFIKESALLAARYETLGVVMNVMGNNAGYTATQMAQFQQGLEATGISMVGARQSLNMMAAAQLDLSKSSELARVAQDAAVISGTNSTEAFEALTRSIQTGMAIIAHRAGIMVSYEKAEREFAATLGKTKEQLTNQELAQARLNAVLEEGRKRQGAYEASMETAGKQLLSMERYVENFKVKFGEAFGSVLKEMVTDMTASLKMASEWIDKNAVGIAEFGEAMRATVVAGEAFLANISLLAGGSGSATDALRTLTEVVRGIGFTIAVTSDVIREFVAMMLKLAQVAFLMPDSLTPWKNWAEGLANQQQAMDKFLTEIEKGNARVGAVAEKTQELAAAQAEINKYTIEYNKLQATSDDKEWLNEVGIKLAYAKQRMTEIKEGIPEVTGPRTNITPAGAAKPLDTKYMDREYDRMNESLEKQLYLLKFGERAAFEHDLQIKKNRHGLAAFTDEQQKDLMATKDRIIAEQDAQKLRDAIWETQQGNYRKEMDLINQFGQAKNEFMFAELDAAQKNADENNKVSASLAMVSKLYDDGSITQRQYTDRVVELNKQLHLETGIFGDLRDTIQNWSKSSTDAFVEFCFTGKNSFGDLINSMLRDLARLAVQKQVMDPLWGYISDGIGAWLGGGTGGGESVSTDMGFGGGNDISGVSMPSYAGASAPASVGSVHVTVNAATGQATTDTTGAAGAQLGRAISAAVQAEIVNQQRHGGTLATERT